MDSCLLRCIRFHFASPNSPDIQSYERAPDHRPLLGSNRAMTYIHLLVRLFPGEHISAFHLYVSDVPIGGELGICVKNRSHPVSQRPAWIQRQLQPR